MSDCVFCKDLPRVMENKLAYALYDINPLAKGHTLVIFKRHFEQIFEASPEEFAAAQELLLKMRATLQQEHGPDGYNIWVNCGKVAGQIVMHAHIHLIPRYKGQTIPFRDHLNAEAK